MLKKTFPDNANSNSIIQLIYLARKKDLGGVGGEGQICLQLGAAWKLFKEQDFMKIYQYSIFSFLLLVLLLFKILQKTYCKNNNL